MKVLVVGSSWRLFRNICSYLCFTSWWLPATPGVLCLTDMPLQYLPLSLPGVLLSVCSSKPPSPLPDKDSSHCKGYSNLVWPIQYHQGLSEGWFLMRPLSVARRWLPSCHALTWSLLCVHVPGGFVCVQISPHQDHSQITLRSTLTAPSELNRLLKGLISNYSRILKY